MSIPFTASINPKGKNTDEVQRDLIRQLQIQNRELKIIIEDLYKQINKIGEG
ncbi:MAG: hypothetical protein J6U86_04455 [Clostridia bacterium]|nr:hypothetical protein [Clostridia bacterium]